MKSTNLAILLALLGTAAVLYNQSENSAEISQFQSWKMKHGVKYDSLFEEQYRERIFLSNLAAIEAHNLDPYKTYEKGVNQFTGLTQDEFVQIYLGTIVFQDSVSADNEDTVSADIDWVSQGAVTDIKDQGKCGSCWAFSTTGSLEGLSKLAYGQLQSFSEQQLVDCSFLKYGNLGCNGGLMDNGFRYVIDHGIVHEDEYPYVAKLQLCKTKGGDFTISGFTDVKTCTDLGNALQGRPVSVAVDATNWSTYSSGVFADCGVQLNHGVLLVGMTDGYWRVKNSWTAQWGESGFIRLARGNTCGICTTASYPNK